MFLIVPDGGMQAIVSRIKPEGKFTELPNCVGEELWLNIIKEEGIVYGINKAELKMLSDTRPADLDQNDFIIAQGKDVKQLYGVNQDYFIEFSKPEIIDGVATDSKLLNFGVDVYAGQLLAEQTINMEPEDGMDIFGKAIVPTKKKEAAQITYKGQVYIEKKASHTKFFSKIDGVLINDTPGILDVQPHLEIRKDVDRSVGNISVAHPIIIHEDIAMGFSIRSKSNIEVKGNVDRNVVIEAGGDVSIDGGVASGSFIKAKGNVSLRFGQGITVKAEGDLHVGAYLFDSKVNVLGKLICKATTQKDKMKGNIIGGKLCALNGMDLASVGSAQALTTLATGFDVEHWIKIKEVLKNIEEIKHDISRLFRRVPVNMIDPKMRDKIRALPLEQKNALKKVFKHVLSLTEHQKSLQSTHDSLVTCSPPNNPDAQIAIGALFPDLKIIFDQGKKLTLHDPMDNITFLLEDNSISWISK